MRLRLLMILAALVLAILQYGHLHDNYAQVLVSKAYSPSTPHVKRLQYLREAMSVTCGTLSSSTCTAEAFHSDESLLRLLDARYQRNQDQLFIVRESIQLPTTDLEIGGASQVNKITDRPDVLYGQGYFQARLFFLSDTSKDWTIFVTAVHDSPPPVLLEVWLDEDKVGILEFNKGNQMSERLSLHTEVTPGLHRLRVWYVNDYFDAETGEDRNAYIEEIGFVSRSNH